MARRPVADSPAEGLRLDKWLYFVRFFKTRGLAAERIEKGGIRLNGQPCRKPGRQLRPGDHLTISWRGSGQREVRAVEVLGLPDRRGPASEAQLSYRDLDALE